MPSFEEEQVSMVSKSTAVNIRIRTFNFTIAMIKINIYAVIKTLVQLINSKNNAATTTSINSSNVLLYNKQSKKCELY